MKRRDLLGFLGVVGLFALGIRDFMDKPVGSNPTNTTKINETEKHIHYHPVVVSPDTAILEFPNPDPKANYINKALNESCIPENTYLIFNTDVSKENMRRYSMTLPVIYEGKRGVRIDRLSGYDSLNDRYWIDYICEEGGEFIKPSQVEGILLAIIPK